MARQTNIWKRTRTGRNGVTKNVWVASYYDAKRARRAKTFATEKAAKAFLVTTTYNVTQGVHTPEKGSWNVHEAAQHWLASVAAKGLERNTRKTYEAVVRLHITPTIGAAVLATLTTPMVKAWAGRLVSESQLSNRLARKTLGTLKSILKEAQGEGLVAQNVALPVSIGVDKRGQKKHRVGVTIPSKDHLNLIFQAATNEPFKRHRALLVTAALTGMRASELRGLTWASVDFDARKITVSQRADAWGTIGNPKSAAGAREITMSALVYNTLREHKLACPRNAQGQYEYVFPTVNGTVQFLQNLTHRVWRPLQRKAGLVDGSDNNEPLYNFHSLRHYAASIWIDLGFTPKKLQTMLGHSSIKMTYDIYGHLFPNDEDDQKRLAQAEIGLVA